MDTLRVNVFPGMANIPILAAMDRGFFAAAAIRVEVQPTPSSLAQRAALLDGTSDICHAAFDDVVAGVEDAGTDFAAVFGGDGGFQFLYAHASIRSPADLRGRTVAVDDPETAYALVLRAVLADAGVGAEAYRMRAVGSTKRRYEAIAAGGDFAASMLAPPYSVLAESSGWHALGSAAGLLGAYQGTVAFCSRAWIAAHGGLLARYRNAYLEGLAWSLLPANRPAVAGLVAAALDIPRDVAAQSCERAIDWPGGLAPDAAFDLEGMRKVIALRASVRGGWEGAFPEPARYLAAIG